MFLSDGALALQEELSQHCRGWGWREAVEEERASSATFRARTMSSRQWRVRTRRSQSSRPSCREQHEPRGLPGAPQHLTPGLGTAGSGAGASLGAQALGSLQSEQGLGVGRFREFVGLKRSL